MKDSTVRLPTSFWALAFIAITASLSVESSSHALTIAAPNNIWDLPAEEVGSWHNASNWSDGVPDALDIVAIQGGQVRIRRGFATAGTLELARYRPALELSDNLLIQSGGRAKFGGLSIKDGTYDMKGGSLSTKGLTVGNAPFLGFRPLPVPVPVPVPDPNSPWLIQPGGIQPILIEPIVPWEPSEGEASEEIPIDPIETQPTIFRFPAVQFHQSRGRARIEDRLSIYGGGVRLSGGRLSTESLLLDVSDLNTLILNDSPAARGFEQDGGFAKIHDSLLIQNGSYTMSAGVMKVDRIAIGDPAMDDGSPDSSNRRPEFRQDGGYVNVAGNLELCAPAFVWPIRPFAAVNYHLEGGKLRVGGDAVVGSMGAAPTNFFHRGGRATIDGTLRIEGDTSRYDISGGKLFANTLEVSKGVFNTGGTFAFSAPADVSVRSHIFLGEESRIEAVPGSRLRFQGDSFENHSTLAANHRGLNDLKLIVESDQRDLLRFGPSRFTTLEVGGEDFGDVSAGYTENFALDTLQVGSKRAANLRLVDLVDNQLEYDGAEALYVDHLHVSPGSILDLGGLSLYYRSANILGEILDGTAKSILSTVPEPGSLSLLLTGLLICGRRRRVLP